ncbi:MAG: hypothetical protein ACOH2F_15990 [Cellulomonas sp.]
MSETWYPAQTTPSGRAAGMRRLTRLTVGLSVGALAATGATGLAVVVHQLEASGSQVLPSPVGGDDRASTGDGGQGVFPQTPSRSGTAPGLIQAAPQRTAPHATTGGS